MIIIRVDKNNYYLNIAEATLERGTCLRRNYGSVIVKNDEVIATGYVGAPRGTKNCIDIGVCKREELKVPRGQQYELCRSVHSEMNAIISAGRKDMIGATIYLCGKELSTGDYVSNSEPCILCKRMIINAGIETVIIRDSKSNYRIMKVQDWIDNEDETLNKIGY